MINTLESMRGDLFPSAYKLPLRDLNDQIFYKEPQTDFKNYAFVK